MRLAKIRPDKYPELRGETTKPEKLGLVAKNHVMWWVAHSIAKRMQQDGYPTVVIEIWRSADRQREFLKEGTSNANAWESPHQYGEAADIVHAGLHWEAPKEYWTHLAQVCRSFQEETDVPLVLGHDWGWDSAHIELADWRAQPWVHEMRKPTELEEARRLQQFLGDEVPIARLESFEHQLEETAAQSQTAYRKMLCSYPGAVFDRFFRK